MKVAVLEGDKIVKDFIAFSYHDSKPVYFYLQLYWNRKSLKKLRPNCFKCYNSDMDSVYRADHLKENYELEIFLR